MTTDSNFPGTNDPCLNCGALGSVEYQQCHAAVAAKVGNVPPCANAGIAQNKQDISNSVNNTIDCAANPAACIQQAIVNSILGPIEAFLPSALQHIAFFLFALSLVVIGFLFISKG